jgi:hypothetical protein
MPFPDRTYWRTPDGVWSAVFLAALLLFVLRFMLVGVFTTWFFTMDEYVAVGEVIRFAQHDYNQRFFDMPGTPFFFLAALAWFLVYAPCAILDQGVAAAGIQSFTFGHLQALFETVRGVTLLMFCASVLLLFCLTSKLLDTAAGRLAALILAMSPTYTNYSSFVRVESMAMCLVIGALLCLAYASDRRHFRHPFLDLVLLAGFLAGAAAGTRLHSMTASLPALFLVQIASPRSPTPDDYPRWVKVTAVSTACSLFAAAGAFPFLRPYFAPWPDAYLLFQRALLGASALIVIAFVMYGVPRMRPLLIRLAPPDTVRLLVGFAVGVLFTVPTIIDGREYFFRSIQFYTAAYLDFDRARLPLWDNVARYARFYLELLFPDRVTLCLFVAGAAGILVTRSRKLVPFLAAAFLFFLSKPLNLRAGQHHILMWLPYYASVSAYPAYLTGRLLRRWPAIALAANGAALIVVAMFMTNGAQVMAVNRGFVQERLANVQLATTWIKARAESDSTIALAYLCFNPDVFYRQMRYLEVPMPLSMLDGRELIWWGNASALNDRFGYLCAAPQDATLKDLINGTAPGDGMDPYTDPRLQLVQTFGNGRSEVDVFRFDNR